MLKKLLALLNTSLGIWLLSSVVLGSISFGYSRFSARLAEDAKRTESIQRLKIEVAQRANQVGAQIADIREASDYDKSRPNPQIAALITTLLSPPSRTTEAGDPLLYAAYQDYKDRPLRSLLVELRILDRPNQETIDKLLRQITYITPTRLKSKPTEDLVNGLSDSYDVTYWGPQL